MISERLRYEIWKDSKVVVKWKDYFLTLLMGMMGIILYESSFKIVGIYCLFVFGLFFGGIVVYLLFFPVEKMQLKDYKRTIKNLEGK